MKALFSRKITLFAAIILTLLVIAFIFAPLLTSFEPNAMRVIRRLRPPSDIHFFGTDELGRDVFSRILYGGRSSLFIATLIVIISVFFGTVLGLLAGYFQRLDSLIMRFIESFMALPDILLAIFLVAILGSSTFSVILALSICYTPRVTRIVRAATLVVKEQPYIEAAKTLGITNRLILSRHILVNIASPIIVQATFIFAYAILAESGLSFLGAGVPPEIPTWGTMIASSQQYADKALWTVLFPGLAIIMTALSLQILGDGLRDSLDPHLKNAL